MVLNTSLFTYSSLFLVHSELIASKENQMAGSSYLSVSKTQSQPGSENGRADEHDPMLQHRETDRQTQTGLGQAGGHLAIHHVCLNLVGFQNADVDPLRSDCGILSGWMLWGYSAGAVPPAELTSSERYG